MLRRKTCKAAAAFGPQTAAESAAWPEAVLEDLEAAGYLCALRDALRAGVQLSTDYSGTGAAEESLRLLVAAAHLCLARQGRRLAACIFCRPGLRGCPLTRCSLCRRGCPRTPCSLCRPSLRRCPLDDCSLCRPSLRRCPLAACSLCRPSLRRCPQSLQAQFAALPAGCLQSLQAQFAALPAGCLQSLQAQFAALPALLPVSAGLWPAGLPAPLSKGLLLEGPQGRRGVRLYQQRKCGTADRCLERPGTAQGAAAEIFCPCKVKTSLCRPDQLRMVCFKESMLAPLTESTPKCVWTLAVMHGLKLTCKASGEATALRRLTHMSEAASRLLWARGKGSVLCLLGRELTKRRKRTSDKWAKPLSMSKSKAGSGSACKAAGLPLPLPLAAPALHTGAAARAPAATSSSNGNKSSGSGAGATRRRRPLGGSAKAAETRLGA